MSDQVQNPVIGQVQPSVSETPQGVSPEMSGTSGVPEQGMPTPASNDGDWQQRIAQLQRQYDSQISQLRSTLDQNFSRAQGQWTQQRQEYENRIRQLEMSQLDEPGRAEYQRRMTVQEVENLRRQNEEMQRQYQEAQTLNQYYQFFISSGVKPAELISDNLTNLVNSGYAAMRNRMLSMERQLQQYQQPSQQQPQQPPQLRQAPPVANRQPGTPSVGPTWSELTAKYGSEERVYSLVEQGILPSSIIPS